jgi:Fic family protein
MDIALFRNSPSGRLTRASGGYWAFVPNPLPPKLEWDNALVSLISKADIAVGTLSGLGETLPNPHLLIYPFIRREAVLSSRIEGTRSSLSDLLLFEATKIEKQRDVKEVQNYVHAMEYGLKRLNELPLSLRFIRELHSILMEGVRGEQATPGEFRQSQNWIGPPGCTLDEAIFIPPPVPQMQECLNQLEDFLHTEKDLPLLVRLALVHYQFEAVHPFLDGNGRIGRLLITLFLCQRKVLTKPLLYLSAFFERHRQDYYDLLLKVSREAGWREWIEFFLRAVVEQSGDAVSRARLLLDLHHTYTQAGRRKKLPPTAGKLIELIFMRPLLNARAAQEYLNVTFPTAQKALKALVEAEILDETTGGKRNKAYAAKEILKILEEDTVMPGSKDNENKKDSST